MIPGPKKYTATGHILSLSYTYNLRNLQNLAVHLQTIRFTEAALHLFKTYSALIVEDFWDP